METEHRLVHVRLGAMFSGERQLGAYTRFGPHEPGSRLEIAVLVVADVQLRIARPDLSRIEQFVRDFKSFRRGNGLLEEALHVGCCGVAVA